MRIASYAITFHAAPSMRQYIFGTRVSMREEREAFLRSVRGEIAGPASEGRRRAAAPSRSAHFLASASRGTGL